MLVRFATTEDKKEWLRLAEHVGDIFEAPNMAKDPEFHQYVDGKLSKHEAIIAMDRMSNKSLGIIGFSRNHNRISWLGVFENSRCKGVGSKLLRCALNQLDWSKDITVVTFPDGYAPGLPARHLYEKFGFIDIDKTLHDKYNNPRCKMALPSSNRKKGGSCTNQL